MKISVSVAAGNSLTGLATLAVFEKKMFDVLPDVEVVTASAGQKADVRIYVPHKIAPLSWNNTIIINKTENRLVLLFNPDIDEYLKTGQQIKISCCAGINTLLINDFLQKAFPATGNKADILLEESENFPEQQLSLLYDKKVNGVLLNLADINLLMQNERSVNDVLLSLKAARKIVLPLFECPPVTGSGLILADITNEKLVQTLSILNDATAGNILERELSFSQKSEEENGFAFYVFTAQTKNVSFLYGMGKNAAQKTVSEWLFDMPLSLKNKQLFSATDYMKDFFSYQYHDVKPDADKEAFFIATHKAIHSPELFDCIASKQVWAAGTRTWYELAKKGIWVNGCADALGLEFLLPVLQSAAIALQKNNIQIITNTSSVVHWKADGWPACGTYELIPEHAAEIQEGIRQADCIFWTSFQQFQEYSKAAKPGAQHLCPAGKTAVLIKTAGHIPFIFPTIKAFNDWRVLNER